MFYDKYFSETFAFDNLPFWFLLLCLWYLICDVLDCTCDWLYCTLYCSIYAMSMSGFEMEKL